MALSFDMGRDIGVRRDCSQFIIVDFVLFKKICVGPPLNSECRLGRGIAELNVRIKPENDRPTFAL